MRIIKIPGDFARRLSVLLAWLPAKQQEVSAATGISTSVLSNVCCERARPSPNVVIKLKRQFVRPKEWDFLIGKTNDITKVPFRGRPRWAMEHIDRHEEEI